MFWADAIEKQKNNTIRNEDFILNRCEIFKFMNDSELNLIGHKTFESLFFSLCVTLCDGYCTELRKGSRSYTEKYDTLINMTIKIKF
ncbi:MAG: hypothetical protein APF83_06155 [Lutibacter sp. BRH_c52]|nr:MAG: hypothetical protein APF83_06155 [Lutibacter sp. BRH_c52]